MNDYGINTNNNNQNINQQRVGMGDFERELNLVVQLSFEEMKKTRRKITIFLFLLISNFSFLKRIILTFYIFVKQSFNFLNI
jgi:hypothetical protein